MKFQEFLNAKLDLFNDPDAQQANAALRIVKHAECVSVTCATCRSAMFDSAVCRQMKQATHVSVKEACNVPSSVLDRRSSLMTDSAAVETDSIQDFGDSPINQRGPMFPGVAPDCGQEFSGELIFALPIRNRWKPGCRS